MLRVQQESNGIFVIQFFSFISWHFIKGRHVVTQTNSYSRYIFLLFYTKKKFWTKKQEFYWIFSLNETTLNIHICMHNSTSIHSYPRNWTAGWYIISSEICYGLLYGLKNYNGFKCGKSLEPICRSCQPVSDILFSSVSHWTAVYFNSVYFNPKSILDNTIHNKAMYTDIWSVICQWSKKKFQMANKLYIFIMLSHTIYSHKIRYSVVPISISLEANYYYSILLFK